MKILFLVPYSLQGAPSQRFRFEQYFFILKKAGFSYEVRPFLTSQNGQVFYKSGKLLEKVVALLTGTINRVAMLSGIIRFDYVFIHREVTPIGPPIFEWIIAKVLRKKMIYDFDDAIWLTDKTSESRLEKVLRWRGKVASICRWSYKVSCGNQYLVKYASQFNANVVINPTTIDLEHVQKFDESRALLLDDRVVIGWTGSHSTLKYLKLLEPVLQIIEKRYPNVSIQVIADRKPDLALERLHFIPWSKETEISDLHAITIGIMPLPDDEWTKGKCGFKALQYMSLAIPTIASPVGVNTTIIQHGVNGMLAQTESDWLEALAYLIESPAERKRQGGAGKQTVTQHYSVSSNTDRFLSFFN